MVSQILRKLQKLAAFGAVSMLTASSLSAGLFCGLECCRPPRPYFSPACEPAWGYHQTCWRQFPPVEPCSGWGDYCASCENGGGVINAGVQMGQGMPYQGAGATPVLPGAPTVIPQPGMRTFAAPMNAVPNYPGPTYNQNPPMQPAPRYGTPAPNVPMGGESYESSPELAPVAPDAGGMPPLPDSTRYQQSPGVYRQASQSWQQPVQPVYQRSGVRPMYVAPQNATAVDPAQGMPVQGVSFSRVRPTPTGSAPVATPKRSWLSRMLPGGK